MSQERDIQANDEDIVIIGSNVFSLYPSLNATNSAAIAWHAVQTSELEIQDVNYEAAMA